MKTPYTLRQDENGKWIAHAIAFDLVAVDQDRETAVNELQMLCIAQVGFAKKKGWNLRHCYFAAPYEYWAPPFFSLEFDPDEYLKWKVTPQGGQEGKKP